MHKRDLVWRGDTTRQPRFVGIGVARPSARRRAGAWALRARRSHTTAPRARHTWACTWVDGEKAEIPPGPAHREVCARAYARWLCVLPKRTLANGHFLHFLATCTSFFYWFPYLSHSRDGRRPSQPPSHRRCAAGPPPLPTCHEAPRRARAERRARTRRQRPMRQQTARGARRRR